jgi:plastocyanin
MNKSLQNPGVIVIGGIVVLFIGMLAGWHLRGVSQPPVVTGMNDAQSTTTDAMNGSPTTAAAAHTSGGAKTAPVTTQTSNTSNTTAAPSVPAVPTVYYTNAGFQPSMIEIKAGQLVRFVNQSNRTMWVKSVSKVPPFIALDTGTSIPQGSSWTFTFTALGTWGYDNDNYKFDTGAVAVMPQ